MRWVRFGLAAALVALSGAMWMPATAQTADGVVYIRSSPGPGPASYDRAGSRVAQHRRVFWENQDDDGHSATANDGSFDTGIIGPGGEVPITFATPRDRIAYHCKVHPTMTGELEVFAAAPPPTNPPAPATTQGTTGTTRPSSATTRRTVTTLRGATTTVGETTTTGGFGLLAPTTSTSAATTTTGDIAIDENDDGSNTGAIAAITVAILAVLTGGGYMLYRLRST